MEEKEVSTQTIPDEDVLNILRLLVAEDTTSYRSTTQIADIISNYLGEKGFSIEAQHYFLRGVKKTNIIAQKGSGHPRLALSGHMDTVPFDPTAWKTDPLKLTRVGEQWFGMGVCDMKGFLAIAMVAGSRIPAEKLKHPFALVFTSDEEVGCIGAKNLVRERGQVADLVVIGEPTELQPFVLHKGYMYLKVILRGKRGHSSRPHEGISVIDALLPVLERIKSFNEHLTGIRDVRLNPPYPTLNVGVVSTGSHSAKNIIPEYCIIELDIRPIPGQNVDEMFRAFRHHISRGENTVGDVRVEIGYGRAPTPPMETVGNALTRTIEEVMGQPATATAFNTEGGVFNSVGMQSTICGIGSIAQAHTPNEFVHASYLSPEIVERYTEVINKICGENE